ncbi:hypothetical protein Tco_0531105 [Tanacetum coccineum]
MDAEHGSEKQKSPAKEKSSEKVVEKEVDTQEELKEVVKEPGAKRKMSIPRKAKGRDKSWRKILRRKNSKHEYKLLSWRLYDFSGIHILLMENGLAIHMLTEKKYPLSQEMLTKMLSRKLEVERGELHAFELLGFITISSEKVSNEDLPRKLVELVNQRKKFFAQQRDEAKRNKPMTPAQQKEYMSTYIKN